jgi:hypothetical protein
MGAGGAASLHASRFNDNIASGRINARDESPGMVNSGCPETPGLEESLRLTDPEAPKPDLAKVGRRSAPRLRLSLPGQLVAIERVHRCILLNLSRTGAQVAILDALRMGEGAILRCGVIDQFAVVTRSEFGLNALQFDEPLSDAQVIEIRHYHENFEERERRALMETARKWVNGETDDGRAI